MSLVEVLVLVLVLGIVGAGTGRSLISLARTPKQNEQQFQLETALVSKMEAIRAMNFDSILTGLPNAALTDTVTVDGKSYARVVQVALVDADGNGLPDATLKAIRVTVDGKSVTTLVSK